MPEWATYSLSDFLPFSPQTYYRLFEIYNAGIWPAHILSLSLGIAILASLHGGSARRGRGAAAMLAACWLWVAWVFHIERYASINQAAPYFAAAFVMEALLLIWTGLIRGRLLSSAPPRAVGRAGLCILGGALFVQPLIGPLLGRPWAQVEIFGIAPDPTVAATLGYLLVTANRGGWHLMPVPIAWCAISGATLWPLGSQDALVMPAVALIAVILGAWNKISSSRHSSFDGTGSRP